MSYRQQHIGHPCPDCGERLTIIFDDQHGKEIMKCPKCGYYNEKPIKKPPEKR